jgi:hypothetical protein
MSCCVERADGVPAGGAAAEAQDIRRLLPGGPAGAAPINLGISNISSGGATYVAPSGGTTLLAATERRRWTSAVGAAQTAGHRNGTQIWNRDAFGGFALRWVVHLQTLINNLGLGHRAYVGLRAATAVIPAINPSTLTNIVGFGFDPDAAPQWSTMVNDAAGLATVTPLGAGFIANTTDLLAFEVSAVRSGADFSLRAVNLTTGVDSGPIVIAANIPALALLLSENVWQNTTADVTTAATIDVAEITAITEPL